MYYLLENRIPAPATRVRPPISRADVTAVRGVDQGTTSVCCNGCGGALRRGLGDRARESPRGACLLRDARMARVRAVEKAARPEARARRDAVACAGRRRKGRTRLAERRWIVAPARLDASPRGYSPSPASTSNSSERIRAVAPQTVFCP
jgi:hypothetical protein